MPIPLGLRHYFYPHGDLRPKVLLGMIRSQRFVRMRWVIAAALLVLYGVERQIRPGFTRPPEVAYCALALMLFNLVWTGLGTRLRRLTDEDAIRDSSQMQVVWFINAQMMVDLLILTVLVRFSGGIENPMIIFYLFHMLIAALLLRPLNALLQGCWALILFGSLAIGECFGIITPHYPFLPYSMPSGPHLDWEYVLVVTVTLAIGVFGTLYFTLRISSRLDEQEQRLHAAMEEAQCNRQALQDLQARRARFMRTAAHQLKSPLAGVQTLAGLIRDGIVPATDVPAVSARIVQRSREGITQVGELLALARIQQADVRTLFGSTCDVGEAVRDLVARHQPIAAEKHIVFTSDIPEGQDWTLPLDVAAVRDCISNLFENAVKYTSAEGRITAVLRRGTILECVPNVDHIAREQRDLPGMSDQYVVLSVKDSGMGVDPKALTGVETGSVTGSIFDAFLRGNQALDAQIPGSGLGLAIVHEIMEQIGGYVFVESQLNCGSTFTLTWPLNPVASKELSGSKVRPTIVIVKPPEHDPAV